MTNKSLVFAGIFAAITTSSFATGENIVTSKSYVDNALEQKQNKIEAYDENNDEYQSVLTDTTTDGVVGKKMILTAEFNAGDPFEAWGEDDDKIPTVGAVSQMAQGKIAGYDPSHQYQSVLTDTTTDGLVEKMQIVTAELNAGDPLSDWQGDDVEIPTIGMVADVAQGKIAGYNPNNGEEQSLLTDTTTDGVVGKKRIMTAELNDGDPLSEWADADELIPTVGAVYQVAQGKIGVEDDDIIPRVCAPCWHRRMNKVR